MYYILLVYFIIFILTLFSDKELKEKTKTVEKPAVSNSTKVYMKELLKHEYDFYYFAKKKFEDLLQHLGIDSKPTKKNTRETYKGHTAEH